jgi:hypothetical protein
VQTPGSLQDSRTSSRRPARKQQCVKPALLEMPYPCIAHTTLGDSPQWPTPFWQ